MPPGSLAPRSTWLTALLIKRPVEHFAEATHAHGLVDANEALHACHLAHSYLLHG